MNQNSLPKNPSLDLILDSYFNVNTIREEDEDEEQGELDNLYLGTPYNFLERLFLAYPFKNEDHLVDFGCGKGRVLFMAAHHHCPQVTGYENHEKRFITLSNNVKEYQKKARNHTRFNVFHLDVQKAEIPDDTNKFFFFEPFHLPIFEAVMHNIELSLSRRKRNVTLFVNLPDKPTLDYFDSLKGYSREIHIDSTLYGSGEALVTLPLYAIYANYSMMEVINPNFIFNL